MIVERDSQERTDSSSSQSEKKKEEIKTDREQLSSERNRDEDFAEQVLRIR